LGKTWGGKRLLPEEKRSMPGCDTGLGKRVMGARKKGVYASDRLGEKKANGKKTEALQDGLIRVYYLAAHIDYSHILYGDGKKRKVSGKS